MFASNIIRKLREMRHCLSRAGGLKGQLQHVATLGILLLLLLAAHFSQVLLHVGVLFGRFLYTCGSELLSVTHWLNSTTNNHYAGVAQLEEHPPCKWDVAGSNPVSGSRYAGVAQW